MDKRKGFLDNPKIEAAVVIALLMIGIYIRAFHFGDIPIGVHQDEAMAAVDAKALADYGTDRFGMRYPVHFTAWIGAQMSVLLSYCMIPFIKLFGFGTFAIRLPMLILSCLSLIVLYYFVRQIGGNRLALVGLLLCTVCPWHYMQSRWSFDCNMFPHMFLIGACLLLAGGRKPFWRYVSMIFFGLCSYCYGIANYSVPVFLLIMAVYLLRTKQVCIRELIVCFMIYFVVALPEFLTMLINMFGMDTIETPLFTIPYFPQSFRSRDILLTNFSWRQMWENIVCTFSTVWWNGDKSVTNTIVKFGPTYYLSNIFFAIGMIVVLVKIRTIKDIKEKTPYVALLLWILMGIWAGIVTKNVTINRINIIFYPVLIVAGIGIVWCIQKWKLLTGPIAAVYGIMALLFAKSYFGEWAEMSRIYYYEPYINALTYAKEIPCDIYYITPDPQGEGVNMVGEILTMYCHEIDAHYYQGLSNLQQGKAVLPYQERYQFQDVTEEMVRENAGKSIVYIVGPGEISLFREDDYEITSFYDAYFVVSEK